VSVHGARVPDRPAERDNTIILFMCPWEISRKIYQLSQKFYVVI
jgi:hypothetical protein